jgi:hypothetical protein
MNEERRRHVRTATDPSYFVGCKSAEAGLQAGDYNLAVRLLDASARGACFVSRGRLRTGLRVQMLIVRPSAGVRASVDGLVRWSTTLESKGRVAHVTGVEFDRVVPALDFGLVSKPPAPAKPARARDPQRRHRRFTPKDASVVCVPREGLARKLGIRSNVASQLKDLSLTGAQIVSRRKLRPGQQVDVEIVLGDRKTTITTEALVRWCRRDTLSLEPRWNAGVLFRTLDNDAKMSLSSVQLVLSK